MRQTLILLMLTIGVIFSFSACSDDDDKDDEKITSLIGKWKYSMVILDFEINKPEKNAAIKKAIEDMFTTSPFGELFELREDGKVVIGNKTDDYEIVSGKLVLPYYEEGYAMMDYRIKGNTLTLFMGVNSDLEDLIKENADLAGVEVKKAIVEIYYTKQ